MKRSGPLFTLLAGLLLALFMLSLNATTGTGRSAYGGGSGGASPTPSAGTPTSAPASSDKPSAKPSTSKPAEPPPDADYAGRTDDDSAAVSVSVKDGKAVAYFCDGRNKESWLKGNVEDDGSMRLTGKHGSKLEGTLAGKKLTGTVDVDKQAYRFSLTKAVKPSGLYRATQTVRGAKLDGGWIVLPDGKQVGILKRDGKPGPAPRIDPETGVVVVDGEKVTARPVVP
ncbi:hypothetical protein [Streptomyces sp. NBC_01304]|uniref:hypothetical protein n=1 Tax=Streptomyces sp. NBC_01304 TaxID=2903818 RepID=UPI002E14C74D|nr:hypothetical protein OG430_37710 [Streptomyces sp. NBC_01304]